MLAPWSVRFDWEDASRMDAVPAPEVLSPLDVLVLGTGLAGLRAAWAALEETPGAVVGVAAPGRGPSGSSFANRHDRLGLHVPADDAERQAFCREAVTLGRPGLVRENLVKILAEEALDRCRELEGLDFGFLRAADGALLRYPSCFSPQSHRAVVFAGLAAAHAAMGRRVEGLGTRVLPGLSALALLQQDRGGRVSGALLEDGQGRLFVQPARTVVVAVGGTASLFLYNQAGRGGTGYGHGLVAAAGAAMANTAYMQWMWARTANRQFWPVWSLLDGNVCPIDASGRPVSVPEAVRLAGAGRADHCPFGHGLADAALDQFLLDQADALGVVAIRAQTGVAQPEVFEVALMAHAANGGAVIDADARTTVPGLFAAGECATGMHGANRIGGAMVAACLVFGARAGRAAAREAAWADGGDGGVKSVLAQSMHDIRRDVRERDATRRFLADALQRHGLPRRIPDTAALEALLRTRAGTIVDIGASRMLESAILFARGQLVA
jgi:L-aspartate oxidase